MGFFDYIIIIRNPTSWVDIFPLSVPFSTILDKQDPSRCGPRCSLLLVIATVPTIDYTPIFSISIIKYFFISAYLLEFIYYISELRRYEYTIKFLALIKVIFSTEKTKKMLFARRRVFLYHASHIAFYRVVRCRFNMFLLNRVPILRYMGGSILF